MALNPNIILGARVPQLPDPLDRYSKDLGIRNSLVQYQGNQMALAAAKRAEQESNALNAFLQSGVDLNSPETRNRLMTMGKSGMEYSKQLDDRRKARLDQQESVEKGIDRTAKFIMANPAQAERAMMAFGQAYGDDVSEELEEIRSFGGDLEAIRKWAAGHALDAGDMLPELKSTDLGDRVTMQRYDKLTGKPIGEGSTQQKGMTPGAAERLDLARERLDMTSQLARERMDLARERANNPAAGAPTLTEILDPTDPTRLLRVDAKVYQSGGLGSPGVLGISGKEPTRAAKETQTEQGRQDVDTQVAALADIYDQLKEGGGITDTSQGALSNVGAGVASSGVGQSAGKFFGTKNQSLRNQIAQQRPLLLQAIKSATGMSAKQMDSNVELKMYLAAATDPTLDYQANMAALENLSKLYGLGDLGKSKTPAAPASPITFDADKERRYQEWKARQGK